jgi:hypothetical protein
MARPGPVFLAFEERLGWIVARGVSISFGYVGRPVQQGGAEAHARIASAYDDPPEIERRVPAFVVRPDRPLVQVGRFFGVDGDGPDCDGAVPGDPDLASDQVIQYSLTPSLTVWPAVVQVLRRTAAQDVRKLPIDT